MASTKEDFVVRYTNKDIMDKLEQIDSKVVGNIQLSKRAMWAGGTAITIALAVLSLLLAHIAALPK
jgi:hypothetical protein